MALRAAKKKTLQAACPNVELDKELGAGGNARVYLGLSAVHGAVAVKFLLNENTKRYARFRDEVLVVTTLLRGSAHVLPILEHQLPSALGEGDFAWYVMPPARCIRDALKNQPWRTRVQALVEVAEGLAALHSQAVAHRDIKPENLFELDGTYRFGDFGIAAFPESAGVTSASEPMGPWGYMAPEMLSAPKSADVFKADVYSLAKTVWAVLTEQKVPFLGHYSADGPVGLSSFVGPRNFVVEPLDTLLESSTRLLPGERPSAQEFAERLQSALAIQGDFERTNPLQWEAAELTALRGSGLVRAVWEGAAEIAQAITALSRRNGLNHCFFPRGGGLTVEGATSCEGGEMLALQLQSSGLAVLRPVRLTLERFPERPDFSYAVLEAADTTALGVESRFKDDEAEDLKQVNEHDYVRDDSDDEEPRNRRIGVPCQRYFKGGVFVIAPTAGIYNRIDNYNGTANKLGRDRLRARFEQFLAQLKQEEASPANWQLHRKVRLLVDGSRANHELQLEHLDLGLLERLIAADDLLVAARKRKGSRPITVGSREFEDLLREKSSEEKVVALALLRSLTKEQRAEYMTLVELARCQIEVDETSERTKVNLGGQWVESYLLEKLGNGYMRKALARYGLEAPVTKP